jgi:hypothetical protein
MHPLAGGDADDLLAELAQQHALAGDVRMGLGHADDVALGGRVEAEQQVGRGEVEEVQGVRLQHLAVVHQAAQLLGAGREVAPSGSSALQAARWCDTGQMPHRRCTITGTSQ